MCGYVRNPYWREPPAQIKPGVLEEILEFDRKIRGVAGPRPDEYFVWGKVITDPPAREISDSEGDKK